MKDQRERRRLLTSPKPVMQRYFRRKVYVWMVPWAMRNARRKMLKPEKLRMEVLAQTMATVAREAARSHHHGFESTAFVLNLALFFLIAERDIQTVKVDALTHPDPWRRSLAARVMLLTLHELDLDKAAGRPFQEIIKNELPAALAQQVIAVMKDIRKAQRRAVVEFSHLRDSTIAHRDRDAVRQHRDITAISGLRVTQIASEFYVATEAFMAVLPKVITHLSSSGNLTSQLIRSREKRATPP